MREGKAVKARNCSGGRVLEHEIGRRPNAHAKPRLPVSLPHCENRPAAKFLFVRQPFVITAKYIFAKHDMRYIACDERHPRRPRRAARFPGIKDIALERIRGCLDLEGTMLPILHALQEEFGYIDEAAEPLIADALDITGAEVHGSLRFITTSGGRRLAGTSSSPAGRKPARPRAARPWRLTPSLASVT